MALIGLLYSCAKISAPLGGPVDEDPPKLLEANPTDQSLNIKPEELILTFDEYVQLDNPSKGIIITPRINKEEVIFTSNKNRIIISLNQELEENTTYVFDFQKSVVDVSEKNPAENLKLVFSTTDYIDSLSISGKVGYIFPPNKIDYKNVLVGIYPFNDTTDVFTANPYYLSQVDTSGNFKISNIKNGRYRAYAWKDDNGNLKAEFKAEEYDFLIDTLEVEEDIPNIQFNLSKSDLTPIRILRTSNFGKNFDLILNKNAVKPLLNQEQLGEEFFFIESDKRVRIYPRSVKADSIAFPIQLQDSTGFKIDTLIYAKFPETDRKPEKLSITPNSGKNFIGTLDMELKFNKPVLSINTDSLYVKYDTASYFKINPSDFYFTDSAKRDLLKIRLSIPDSISKEIFTLTAADSTFKDIEDQYNEDKLEANYRKLKRESLADGISGRIEGANPPFILQVLDSKNQIIREEFLTTEKFSIELIEPGTFKLRVIEDRNGNQRWDPSNILEKRPAERVFFYKGEDGKEQIVIRSGWTLEDQIIKASPPTGINQREMPVDK
ncbi:Ig-like domain-containing protein [Algoriphagus confluentis]|uniref:Ig-like domain-containing protein n=1 Tax=Algoriphagus confluentis TaxID=1697556 RepID=A0ABQ6PSI9_9BACT|nr:Ig-like domain-containing protein [Algoriphagus confluentis]